MTGAIVQFGTSRFLQAHVDLLAQQAADLGQVVPPIIVVQTTGETTRARRLAGFNDPAGFPVIVRGRDAGGLIDRTTVVRSVERGLGAHADWAEVVRIFTERATCVVSNSGDNGFTTPPPLQPQLVLAGTHCPDNFPTILLSLLHQRWLRGGDGLTLLPCELVRANATTLAAVLLELARAIEAPSAFIVWLRSRCLWVNTLVDRIVSQSIDPVGAVAEPYALWAIEDRPGLIMPFEHPDIVITRDLEQYERLKLHILNLGHTWIAEQWHRAGGDAGTTVASWLRDRASSTRLERLYMDEVVPGFEAHGMGDEARSYVATTLDRFTNPFLAHRVADIFVDHRLKVARRVTAFLAWVDAESPGLPLTTLRGWSRDNSVAARTTMEDSSRCAAV